MPYMGTCVFLYSDGLIPIWLRKKVLRCEGDEKPNFDAITVSDKLVVCSSTQI